MSRSKTVLISGGTGLLALNWACAIWDSWHVILGTHQHRAKLNGMRSAQLNLDDEEKFGQQLDTMVPDLVVHTAGLTNVDQCEQAPDLAYQANAVIARTVARATAVRNIPLIHVSTDHLFTGNRSFYEEEALPSPLNEYGKTKLQAEAWVLSAHPNALIIRTNFFGWGHAKRQSLTDWLIYNMREGKQLTLFDDVFFTPILADKLALAAHALIEKGTTGIVNVVGDERLSKYQFALKVCEQFNLPETLILRGQIAQSPLSTPRPADMSLNNAKAKKILGHDLGGVSEFLAALHAQEMMGRQKELFEAVN